MSEEQGREPRKPGHGIDGRPLVWPRRPRPASFQPRATLGVIYTACFGLLWALVLIAPTLLELLRTLPPGPELEAATREAAREAARPRLLLALALGLATTALGARLGILPGIRRRVDDGAERD